MLAQQRGRPERIGGKPNLNGIWQAVNEAHWNLEGHSAQSLSQFARQLGAVGAIPAGQSVVVGGAIPYLPGALAKRDENRAGWPAADPEAKCYMPGIPRATYMPYPFQIVQGEGDQTLFSAHVREREPSDLHARPSESAGRPLDGAIERLVGW